MEANDGVPHPPLSSMFTHMKALCTELWNLRAEGEFCDVVFNVQGEMLLAHSVVLSACSPYLKKLCMDRSSITPSGAINIHIDDYSYKVCLKTLEFLYMGERVYFEETDLASEFEGLSRDWKLFGSANPIARNSDDPDQAHYLMGIRDCIDVPNSTVETEPESTPRKEKISRLKSNKRTTFQKENIPSQRKSLDNDSGSCTPLNSQRKKKAESKNLEQAVSEMDSEDEEAEETPDKDTDSDNLEEESSEGKLRLRSSKRRKVKVYQEFSEEEFEDEFSETNNEDTEDAEKPKSKPQRPKRLRTKGLKLKRKVKTTKSPTKKGERRGRRNQCYRCGIRFDTREEYLAHGKEVHPRSLLRKQGLTCKVCNAQFYHHNLLQLHRLENHWEEGMKPAKIYKCDFENCTYNTSRYAAYNQHRKAHTAETCVCDICGKLMKNRFSLKSHVEIIHERKQEKYCEKCDKTFSTRQAFKNHNINLHLGKRVRLFCSRCGYSCNRQETLNEHMLSFHDEQVSCNVFTCCICDFKTTEKRKLERHERTHNLGERLQCEECGKSYTSRTSLNHHKRIHNNTAKIYKCTYCDYKTVYGVGSLRQHVRCMHKDKEMKPWKCTDCSYAAMTEDILSHHKTTIHGHPLPDKPPDTGPRPSLDPGTYKKSRSRPSQPVSQNQQPEAPPRLPPNPDKDISPTDLLPNIQPMNPQSMVEMRAMPNHTTMVNPQESVSRSDGKTLPSLPVISRTTASGFVDVPLNYSLFRSTANQNFPYDPSQPTSPQVLMAQTQMGQNPMLPGNLNGVPGWGDFQSF